MTKKTGGPAFPTSDWYVNEKAYKMHGMTLRDYFAAKALQGMIVANGDSNGYLEYEEEMVAKNAYKLADAMLEARK